MSLAVNGLTAASSSRADSKPHLASLPREALDAIFEYAHPRDLINLMLVSQSFREAAAARLYRQLNHVFADEDNKAGQLNVDHLAGILETLTTSDYNYAGHIKEISMDTVSTGESAEKASREFKYEYSCGKFLNTLLLATLKKIRALESFRWNVRVEISQSVFTTLSHMSSLQHLHVRLQAGRSLHSSLATTTPAPLMPPPVPVSIHPPPPHHHHPHTHHHHHPPPPNQTGLGSYVPNVPKCSQCNGDGRPPKRLGVHKPTRTPQNFSKFWGLKSLAILDMDTLEYIPEIAECILSSSSSLNHLSLSFSEALALKARKKALPDTSETETVQDDDEFDDGMALPPPPVAAGTPPLFGNTPAPASNEADIRRERAAQEKALSRIFSLEKETPDQKKLKQAAECATVEADKEAQVKVSPTARDDADRVFVTELKTILKELSRKKLATGGSSKGVKSIEIIEKAATKYLERSANADLVKERKNAPDSFVKGESSKGSGKSHAKSGQEAQGNVPGPAATDIPIDPALSSGSSSFNFTTTKQEPIFSTWNSSFPQPGKVFNPTPPLASAQGSKQASWKLDSVDPLKSSSSPSEVSDVTPPGMSETPDATTSANDPKIVDEFADVVDIEHPDDDGEEVEDQEFLDDSNGSPMEAETPNPVSDDILIDPALSNGVLEAEPASFTDKGKGKEPVRETNGSQESQEPAEEYSGERAIQEYIRQNHGIALESLSIYLIPVRASVLCRAVDISALRHISLLNVGPQRAFWAMATKLLKTTPFQLTSVHTDNVMPSLLIFLNNLDHLTELFVSERCSRSKVEPLVPKTVVSIDEIKTQILKKHIKHLKRLVIRNDDDNSWALNKDSVRLITKYGQDLKELGISLGSTNFHLFMQNIGRLRSLVALQINFVHNDNCPSVLREIRSCAVDNIMHFPYLKIEYVAVGHTVHGNPTSILAKLVKRSTRRSRTTSSWAGSTSTEPTNAERKKDKGKGKEVTQRVQYASESEDDFGAFSETSIRVIDNFKPTDVTGIKMWEKEVWGLRL